jgi:hypothetical protein
MRNVRRWTQHTRLLYELLFSVHCAFLIVAREDLKAGSVLRDGLQAPLLSVDRLFGNVFHHTIFSHDVPHLFFGSWTLLAVIIFGCLRVLGRIAFVRRLFCRLAAVVAVAGPPFCFFFTTVEGQLVTAGWLKLEVAVIVAGVLLYMHRGWPTSAMLSILVLLMHFGLWGMVIWGPFTWRAYLWQVGAILVLPFCTSLAWIFYLRLSGGTHSPDGRPVV